jgi:hypothetical protein
MMDMNSQSLMDSVLNYNPTEERILVSDLNDGGLSSNELTGYDGIFH